MNNSLFHCKRILELKTKLMIIKNKVYFLIILSQLSPVNPGLHMHLHWPISLKARVPLFLQLKLEHP
jgi:hypothetical protein